MKRSLLVVLLGVFAITGHGIPSAKGENASFFGTAWTPVDLPSDKLYPQGTVFPIGGYAGNIDREAANGFTFYGPSYGRKPGQYALAKEHGLFAIGHVGIDMNFHARGNKPILELSSDEVYEKIAAQVDALAPDENIAWWALYPEELRFWIVSEMDYLKAATQAIRDHDPLGRPIFMYEPNNRDAASLMETGYLQDIIARGMYPNGCGQKDDRVWCRWAVEQQRLASEGLENQPFYIAVPEMYIEPDTKERVLIEDWVRHDTYVALIGGAKGVFIYSLSTRPNFPSHGYYYAAYAKLARELAGDLGLGQVFLFGERLDALSFEVVSGPEAISPKVGFGGVTDVVSYSPLSTASMAYEDERYLFMANSANESIAVIIEGIPEGVLVYDVFDGTEHGELELVKLGPLEVKAFRLTSD